MTIIINMKNYPEILGPGSVELAKAAERVARQTGATIIVAPPGAMVALVAASVSIPVFSQTVGSEQGPKSTGGFVPEAVKGAGASGTLLNHSESPKTLRELRRLVPRAKRLPLSVCLCGATAARAVSLAALGPDHVAIEPPALIGSGVAVSKARPELVSDSVSKLRGSGFRGKILCGAGIVTGEDVRRAMELGADGVLVSSSVVKAGDWASKISELAGSLA